MTELWRPCPDFEGIYEVSDTGRVRSLYVDPPRLWKEQAIADVAQAFARHRLAAEAAAIERLGEAATALQWLSTRPTLELHHYMPVYGDDDDDAVEWRVTRVSGSINDREWTTVGQGETPLAAILDAALKEGASHVG